MNSTNLFITLDVIKLIIKSSHIFNNLILIFRPKVIKASSKSDIIDIWNTQSGKNAKILINRYFNIRRHIVTIYGANINPEVP